MPARFPHAQRLAALLLSTALAGACDKGGAATQTNAEPPATPSARASAALEVVSAAPSATAVPADSVAAEVGSAAPASSAAGRSRPHRSKGGSHRVATPAAAPKVVLLEAGAEPRTRLRYEFTVGHEERVKLGNQTTVGMKVSGKKQKAPATPEIEITAALRVAALLPGGMARRELRIASVDVLPSAEVTAELITEIKDHLAGLEKLKGSDVVDDRGVLHEASLDTSGVENPELKALMDAMQQSFGQMGAPFPEEEVGVGARWEVVTKVSQQGLNISQTATYELGALDGKKGHLKIKLVQSAPGGKMSPPGLPPGATAELLKMAASGTGEIDFDLTRCLPRGKVQSRTSLQLRAKTADQSQDVSLETTVNVRFSPVD